MRFPKAPDGHMAPLGFPSSGFGFRGPALRGLRCRVDPHGAAARRRGGAGPGGATAGASAAALFGFLVFCVFLCFFFVRFFGEPKTGAPLFGGQKRGGGVGLDQAALGNPENEPLALFRFPLLGGPVVNKNQGF